MKDTNAYMNRAIYLLNGDKETNYANAKRLLSRLGYSKKNYGAGKNFLRGYASMMVDLCSFKQRKYKGDTICYCEDTPTGDKYMDFLKHPEKYQDTYLYVDLEDYDLPVTRVMEFNFPDTFDYACNNLYEYNDCNNGYASISILIDNAHTIDINKIKQARTDFRSPTDSFSPLAPIIKAISKPYEFNEYKTPYRDFIYSTNHDYWGNGDLCINFGFMSHVPALREMLESLVNKTFNYNTFDTAWDNRMFKESFNGDEFAKAWYLQNLRANDDCGNMFGDVVDNGWESMFTFFEVYGRDNDSRECVDKDYKIALKRAKTPEEKQLVEDGYKYAKDIDFSQF